MENKQGFGALPSPYDHRTVIHQTEAVAPAQTGGVVYEQGEHLNQWYVGICAATWIIQNRQKANGKKYSYDFQYLLQKKYVDGNWDEGSCILSSLKIGKNYGFLPAGEWTHTTESDLQLPYSQYIAKLQAIPDAEIQRLLALCGDKIAGYASVDVSSPQTIAKAIIDAKTGIGCRFLVGPEWYTPTTPLPAPTNDVIGAHAIGMSYFNYVVNFDQKLANSWGDDWDEKGNADIDGNKYKPTEAWIILDTTPVIAEPTIKQGSTGVAVEILQTFLNLIQQAGLTVDGQFGMKTNEAVRNFQRYYGLSIDGIVGQQTWQAIDMINIITTTCEQNGVESTLGIAVADAESRLNPKATLFNPGSNSTDRGLYQWNSVYHAEITDVQAFDPASACTFFCEAVKAGKLHEYWSASQPYWSTKVTPAILAKYGA